MALRQVILGKRIEEKRAEDAKALEAFKANEAQV